MHSTNENPGFSYWIRLLEISHAFTRMNYQIVTKRYGVGLEVRGTIVRLNN